MGRTERVYRIEMLIRNRGCVSFAAMQDELEVSPATLKRDLEYLRSRMDAPIVYDRFANGYKFDTQPDDRAQAQHELPGLWFNEREIHALLTMYQLIQELDSGGMLARHLQPLLDKLHGMLGTSEREAAELMKRVKIVTPARRPVEARFFEMTGSALLQRRRIKMTYYTRGRKAQSEREVSPQRLVHYRNTWYLDAWCHTTDGLRRFSLDAIRGASLLQKRARDVAIKQVESELDGGYGIFAGAKRRSQWAALRFSPEAAQWVQHEQWHPAQEATLHEDGSLTLRVPFADATELAMDVMRHGDQVTVLAPAVLVTAIGSAHERAASNYHNPERQTKVEAKTAGARV
ncbi:MAG: WYL domain-containing protein [Burkholderiaceae bacterium]|nr:MAG: WYL domain-containing protein [Burkholderiaceae bacterium]